MHNLSSILFIVDNLQSESNQNDKKKLSYWSTWIMPDNSSVDGADIINEFTGTLSVIVTIKNSCQGVIDYIWFICKSVSEDFEVHQNVLDKLLSNINHLHYKY